MIIRFATLDDVQAFVDMGRRFHSLTRFRIYDYKPEMVRQQLTALIGHKAGTHCFLVAVSADQQPVGGLVGCIESHLFSDQPVATLIHYDVLPEHRLSGAAVRLLTAFRKWAENREAFELCVGVNSGVDLEKMDRFFRKLGFEVTGGNYALKLVFNCIS